MKTKVIHIRLSEELLNKFMEIKSPYKNISEVIRDLIIREVTNE